MRRVKKDLERLPRGRDVLWSGDFNAHHPSWDENLEEDALGEALVEFMEDYSLNDGKGTWYARREGCQATSAPDLTIEAAAGAGSTSWSRLQNLSSDHIPILVEWRKPYKAETRERKAMPNTQKVDWVKYAEALDRELATPGEEGPPEARYKQLVNAI